MFRRTFLKALAGVVATVLSGAAMRSGPPEELVVENPRSGWKIRQLQAHNDARMESFGRSITDEELTTWHEDAVLWPAIASPQRYRAMQTMMVCVPRLITEVRRLRKLVGEHNG